MQASASTPSRTGTESNPPEPDVVPERTGSREEEAPIPGPAPHSAQRAATMAASLARCEHAAGSCGHSRFQGARRAGAARGPLPMLRALPCGGGSVRLVSLGRRRTELGFRSGWRPTCGSWTRLARSVARFPRGGRTCETGSVDMPMGHAGRVRTSIRFWSLVPIWRAAGRKGEEVSICQLATCKR